MSGYGNIRLMNRTLSKAAALLLVALTLAGCGRLLPRHSDAGASTPAAPASARATQAPASPTPQPSPSPTLPVLRSVPPLVTRPADAGLPGKAEMLSAFREIAFTSEYPGAPDERGEIRKWAEPVRLAVHGSPTREDEAALALAMDALNALPGFPGISLEQADANADIWFVELDQMEDVISGYVEGNWGFFTVTYDTGRITHAAIAIATDVTDQSARTHLIYEELLQSTGLMQDSYTYPESIFYSEWTTVPEPLPMDWELLKMLYMEELTPGMSVKDAMAKLDDIYP